MALALGVSALSASSAHAFAIYAQAIVNPHQVVGQVMNSFPQPVVCAIRVQGLRNDGMALWANANVAIYPGNYGYAYVYTSYPFAFVNGQAWADCRFMGPYGLMDEELEALGAE